MCNEPVLLHVILEYHRENAVLHILPTPHFKHFLISGVAYSSFSTYSHTYRLLKIFIFSFVIIPLLLSSVNILSISHKIINVSHKSFVPSPWTVATSYICEFHQVFVWEKWIQYNKLPRCTDFVLLYVKGTHQLITLHVPATEHRLSMWWTRVKRQTSVWSSYIFQMCSVDVDVHLLQT